MQQSLKDGVVVPLQGTGVSWVGRNEWQMAVAMAVNSEQ